MLGGINGVQVNVHGNGELMSNNDFVLSAQGREFIEDMHHERKSAITEKQSNMPDEHMLHGSEKFATEQSK
jgi:hypothetical protein